MGKKREQLKRIFNLNTYEAKIYLAALNFESVNLTDLAKRAKLPRTAAYQPIQNLVKQGFLSITKIGKRKYYQALSPKELNYIFERKKVDPNTNVKLIAADKMDQKVRIVFPR